MKKTRTPAERGSSNGTRGRQPQENDRGFTRPAPSTKAGDQTFDLLERVSDGLVAFDSQMNYTYVNRRGAAILGRKPEDLIGKNYWVEFPEARGTPFANAYLRALETHEMIVLEEHYTPWDRWFENRIYPSRDGLVILFTEITEKKKAELKLRETQERLALAIRSANVGLWDWDLLTNKVYYSPEWKSQLGYEHHEISSDFSEWENRVHPDDLERSKAIVTAYLEKSYPNYQNEFRMRHKDGSYRWILAQASLLNNEQGKPIRMIGSHIDITERKRAEEVLQRSQQTFEVIFEKALYSAALAGLPEGRFEQVNEEFEKLFGYPRQEVIGKTSLELGMYPDPEARLRVSARVRERGYARDIETKLRTKSGEELYFLVNTDFVQIGEEKHILTTAQDITKRKRAEEQLQRSEEVLRLFVEHAPAAIAMFDRDMKYIAASRRYLSDYELGEQELAGRSHYEVFPDIPERWKEIHRRCQAGAIEKAEEDPFLRLSGKVDWIRWEIHPWYIADGEIGGVILFSEVITERKHAEEELRLSRDRLADLSRRLVEVHEADSREIGRELHDQIGQILTALRLTLGIASQLPPEISAQKLTQAQELVDELLRRVSSLSLELRPPMLDDLGLLAALLWHVNRYQEQSGIQVTFKHSGIENQRFVSQIETTAYRTIQETLTNVARHAQATRARLEVRTGGGWMEIYIEDDGVGFDPQAAFVQHRGLSGIRERAQLVGGTFQVESEPGKGTRKLVRLPLQEAAS